MKSISGSMKCKKDNPSTTLTVTKSAKKRRESVNFDQLSLIMNLSIELSNKGINFSLTSEGFSKLTSPMREE